MIYWTYRTFIDLLTYLCYKLSTKRMQNSVAYKLSQRLFLQEEITSKTLERKKVNSNTEKLKTKLLSTVSFIDWTYILHNLERKQHQIHPKS